MYRSFAICYKCNKNVYNIPFLNEYSPMPTPSLNDENLERLHTTVLLPLPTPKAKPCFSFRDFRRAIILSCCFSRSVGAALNCPVKCKNKQDGYYTYYCIHYIKQSHTHIPFVESSSASEDDFKSESFIKLLLLVELLLLLFSES